MPFLGADTAALRDIARSTKHGGQRIEDIIASLDGLVQSVDWTGPDADAFRDQWASGVRPQSRDVTSMLDARGSVLEENAEEQDSTSDEGGSGSSGGDPGSPWEQFQQALRDYEPLESDGFFGDLLGGPESGIFGNIAWNTLSTGLDLWGAFPGPVATAVGLPFDVLSIGIGLYDAAQSFQDGELYGTVDGLMTAGINTADATFGVLSLIPYTAPIGEAGGMVTGGLDALWSGATIAAQIDAARGGDSGGSTTRFLLDAIGVPSSSLDVAEGAFGIGSEWLRDQVPILDPILDVPQVVVENIVPNGWKDNIETWSEGANDWISDIVPW